MESCEPFEVVGCLRMERSGGFEEQHDDRMLLSKCTSVVADLGDALTQVVAAIELSVCARWKVDCITATDDGGVVLTSVREGDNGSTCSIALRDVGGENMLPTLTSVVS